MVLQAVLEPILLGLETDEHARSCWPSGIPSATLARPYFGGGAVDLPDMLRPALADRCAKEREQGLGRVGDRQEGAAAEGGSAIAA